MSQNIYYCDKLCIYYMKVLLHLESIWRQEGSSLQCFKLIDSYHKSLHKAFCFQSSEHAYNFSPKHFMFLLRLANETTRRFSAEVC